VLAARNRLNLYEASRKCPVVLRSENSAGNSPVVRARKAGAVSR
jgi:hypothetical protein